MAWLWLALWLPFALQATTYVLPKDDVIGQLTYANVKAGETLLDIARRYDVGIDAIKKANPGVDAWLPGVGTKVLIPTRHILPKGAREGIVVNIPELRLYHYTKPEKGPALVASYPISIAGKIKSGDYKVAQRVRKPTWVKPWNNQIVPPGKNNPLGEYSVHLKDSPIMIHGTNKPYSIGMKVDHGSIRMYPEDIEVMVHQVSKDIPVRIVNQPLKYGYRNGALYLELHKPESAGDEVNMAALVNWMSTVTSKDMWEDDWQRAYRAVDASLGVAEPVAQLRAKTKQRKEWWLRIATYKTAASARATMNKIEPLGVPMQLQGCYDNKPCKLVAGPFKDLGYIDDLRKRVKWITRIKAVTEPYVPEDDMANLNNHMAGL